MRTIWRSALLATASVLAPILVPILAATPAMALPNAPYQNDPAYAVSGAPQPYDRYGGGAAHPIPMAPGAQVSAAPGTYLAWTGKTDMQPQAAMPAQSGGWTGMAQRWSAEPQAQAQAAPPQPALDNGWRPLPAPPAAQPARPNLYDALRQQPAAQQPQYPQNAYPQPAPVRVASSQGGPRFYSLHREYGLQPDAIPLPPQFFGPTADLSAPATDPVVKRTTTVNGKTQTVVIPQDQGAQ